MKGIHPLQRPALLLLCVILSSVISATGQGITIERVPGTNGRPASIRQDQFDALVSSSASFDTDSPVEARAEFDPPTIVPGGQTLYRVIISALDESLKLPDKLTTPEGLALQLGGRGQIYQPMGNARVRPMTTVIYRATSVSSGTFTIQAFEAIAYGKPVKVPAATLRVVAPGEAVPSGPLRLLLNMPQSDVFVGQTIRVPVMLPLSEEFNVLGMSQARITGEFIFAEPSSPSVRRDTINRNQKIFPVFVQEATLTPLREGKLEIIGQAYSMVSRPAGDQTNIMQTGQELVDSDPAVLTVLPLPKEGELAGFTGAVGAFRIDPPRLSTNEVRAGEPLTLMLAIRGGDNLGRLTPPPPPLSADWQAFPPIGDNAPAAAIQQRGFATFTYTLIPVNAQVKSTPPIPFSCFDPAKKAYVDLTVPPVAITVKPSPTVPLSQARSARPAFSGPEQDDTSNQEKELVMTGLIEKRGAIVSGLSPLQSHGWFLALQLLPASLLAGLLLWDRRRRFLAAHPEVILNRRARRGLRRQLGLVRRAAAAQDAAGFAKGATNALREVCAPRFAANPAALVCADVLNELPESEKNGRQGEMVRHLFAAADARSFGGPDGNNQDVLTLKTELERTLAQLKARL